MHLHRMHPPFSSLKLILLFSEFPEIMISDFPSLFPFTLFLSLHLTTLLNNRIYLIVSHIIVLILQVLHHCLQLFNLIRRFSSYTYLHNSLYVMFCSTWPMLHIGNLFLGRNIHMIYLPWLMSCSSTYDHSIHRRI